MCVNGIQMLFLLGWSDVVIVQYIISKVIIPVSCFLLPFCMANQDSTPGYTFDINVKNNTFKHAGGNIQLNNIITIIKYFVLHGICLLY